MPLSQGQVLNNRYRIVKLLGQGGFGAVYRAWDTNLSKPCAVKENLDTSPEAGRQFAREASVLANLSHPNLPRVTDHFTIPGQGQYLVMDFVEGEDLQSMVTRQGPVAPELALEWVSQVADALTYLHSRQPPVVHRDIKPANIRITPEGKAMLVDFGLVKFYDPTLRTTKGARAVTPGYSPPEQYGTGITDSRSDIYSLGATLYTLLTGEVPADSVDVLSGIQPPPPPVTVVNRRVSKAVSEAIQGAMQLNRSVRIQSGVEFKAALTSPAASRTFQRAPVVSPALSAPSVAPAAVAIPSPGAAKPGLKRLAIGGVVGLLILVGIIYAASRGKPAATQPAPTEAAHAIRPTSTAVPTETALVLPTPAPPTATPLPKELVVCMPEEPANLFPYNNNSLSENHVLEALMDGPIDTRNFDYRPVILEELPAYENGGIQQQQVTVRSGDSYVDASDNVTGWSGSDTTLDQWIFTYRLKPGLKWSDGAPLIADDSLFGYETARGFNPDVNSNYQYLTDRTASYTMVDDLTVQWKGLPGYKPAIDYTNFFTPLPRHTYGHLSPDQMLQDDQALRRPLGWGAFRFVQWVAGDHVLVEKNPFYFRASEGLPYIATIKFRFISDVNQRLQDLLSGGCDIGTQSGDWGNVIPDLRTQEAAGALKLQSATNNVFEHLDFDLQPLDKRFVFFSDVRVRQAVAHCIDRQTLIDRFLYGVGSPPDSFLPPAHPYYAGSDRLAHYKFDPEQGRLLLEQAGWRDTNGDGIVENGGRKFSVTYYVRDNSLRQQVAPFIVQQLHDNCGIEARLEFFQSELFKSYPDGLIYGRRFDLTEFGWLVFQNTVTCDLYVSRNIPGSANPGGNNITGYSNSDFDAACNAGFDAQSKEEKAANFSGTQEIFSRDLPVLPLFWRVILAANRANVAGFTLEPTLGSELWNIEAFDLAR